MGRITIEVPLNINKKFRIVSEASAQEVLSKLESHIKNENRVDENEILKLWSDRPELTNNKT